MKRWLVVCLLALTLAGCMEVNCAVWRPAGYYCPPEMAGGKR